MWLDEKNNEDPYNRTQSQPGGPSVGTGGGTTQTGGTTSNPSTTNPIQPNTPSQAFGTVQDYLGANKQQGEQLGQQFTNSLAKSATNEKQAIDTAAGQTSQDITAGSTPFNANLVNKAVTDPTKVTGNPDDLNSFLKQWNASYTGPSSFENSANYAPATAAVSEAATKQTEAGTTGGQQQLLQDEFGVYGQGNKGLDQNLIQNSGSNPAIQAQAKQFGTLPDYLKNAAAPINTQANKAAADTAATQSQTEGAFTNVLTDFQKKINDETAANRATAQANYTAAENAALNPIETKLQQNYGITPDIASQRTFNPNVDITPENAASAQDYADAAAYQQLTGKDFTGVLNPNNVTQAGQWASPTLTAGIPAIQKYLQSMYDAKLSQKTLPTPGAPVIPGSVSSTIPATPTTPVTIPSAPVTGTINTPIITPGQPVTPSTPTTPVSVTAPKPIGGYVSTQPLPTELPTISKPVVEPPLVSTPISQPAKAKVDAQNQIDFLTKRMATLPAHSGERGVDQDQIANLKKQYNLATGGVVKKNLRDYFKEVK